MAVGIISKLSVSMSGPGSPFAARTVKDVTVLRPSESISAMQNRRLGSTKVLCLLLSPRRQSSGPEADTDSDDSDSSGTPAVTVKVLY